VIAGAMPLTEVKPHERRRHQRVKVVLLGRYMLEDRCEYPCQTIDISPGGVAIEGAIKGAIGERVVAENDGFLTVAPYAPRFPFETWILPMRHESAFENSSSQVYEGLAKALKNLLMRADKVLDYPAYNLVIHTAPVQEAAMDHYHWHIEFMPRLTKIAGFEWGTGFYQNPTPPEEAAKYLREAKIELSPHAVAAK